MISGLPVQSAAMPTVARGLVVAAMFALLSAPPLLQRWVGGDTRAYVLVTIVMAVAGLALVAGWPASATADTRTTRPAEAGRYIWTAISATSAVALLVVAAHSWVGEILTIPIDPYRGDMLVVVREGLRRVFDGLNPYTIYHVPWAAPLPYGPMLWAPYAVPMALHLDLRFLTVAGELFVPIACAVAAVVSAWRGRLAPAIA